jgi:hypothetical protein
VASSQTAYPRTVRWHAPALAQGDAGLALTCAYLDACFPGKQWDRTGHCYLASAAEAAETSQENSTGLFSGLAGLAFAAWALSRGGIRYGRLLSTLDEVLLPQLTIQAERLARVMGEGVGFGKFDAISGVAGAGAILLRRLEVPAISKTLTTICESLIALTSADVKPPRWWTPAALMGNEDTAALYPHGNLNCGLAHGIPGVLAFMSLAMSNGIRVPDAERAIEQVANWLIAYKVEDAWGVNWPYAVPLADNGLPEPPSQALGGSRSGWCYGAPGVARALWLAGVARDRADWRDLAVEAMAATYRRPMAARQIDSPTLCHGVSGLLAITLRFANETGHSMFAEAAGDLTEWLLAAFESETLVGFRNWEPGGTRVDQPGLLEGAAGVLLALLAASTDVEPTWDRAFLLA